jgi:hypothetical protein
VACELAHLEQAMRCSDDRRLLKATAKRFERVQQLATDLATEPTARRAQQIRRRIGAIFRAVASSARRSTARRRTQRSCVKRIVKTIKTTRGTLTAS